MTEQEFNALAEKERQGIATAAELAALEPYRARRAVFMAAGFGSRLAPLTLTTPKPLIPVFGRPIIASLLDAVLAAGIEEIYLVRGYMGEAFNSLLEEYPMIQFIENPLYDETNNISSILQASEYLQNAYVFEADLLLQNPGLICKYQYSSNFLGVPVAHTDDWCFPVKDGVIQCVQKGGDDCCHMFGVSYWSEEDGRRLGEDLPAAFQREENRQAFFEAVPLNIFHDHYTVRVRPCAFSDIQEIDTLDELKALDKTYVT
ncbi:MAG: phosphocholine cytidylyltransferase family protein [Oscillospiraceae bacterium]|nr:phosphocholine cytidylyltransferase family protein [Oscillospiraceae bacterium]